MVSENPFNYQNCPECGMLTFVHDVKNNRHICKNDECAYEEKLLDAELHGDSILTKLLRLLRIKK